MSIEASRAEPVSNPPSEIRNSLAWLPFLLQTSDPLFPTGAYAHSLGLEEVVRLGVVRDEATLGEFLTTQIIPALAAHELPYLRCARDAAIEADLDACCAIDREISAWKLCRELRQASNQLGTRRLKMLLQIAPSEISTAFSERVSSGNAEGHHLTICGLQFASMPLHAALATYFYQTLSAICGASLKLIRIGQEGCQRVLRHGLHEANESIAKSLMVDRDHSGWFNPLLEIASMRHECADERLFIS